MADIVNLRLARKARTRADAEAAAAANRAAHGRTKAQKQADRTEQLRRAAVLDGARIDPD
ncbi:MAG: hypothetical protein JWL91_642 [Sphingomonas bacterium]|nr:DUF4169 family protein [Sphingomonas bacterium]MDB5688766.1 hypothetical protein [Sphingomonas bacterium]